MKRICVLALALAGCTTEVAPSGSAMFAGLPSVISARAQSTFVTYGAPFHAWTITLSTADGCAATAAGAVEIDTLASTTDAPLGPTTLRLTEAVQTVPSAFARFTDMTTVSGTITITQANTALISGSIDAQLSGMPLSGTFTALICK